MKDRTITIVLNRKTQPGPSGAVYRLMNITNAAKLVIDGVVFHVGDSISQHLTEKLVEAYPTATIRLNSAL